jgi:hypothetical protein
MIDFLITCIKYVIFYKWNRISKESIELLDIHWENKPTNGLKLWLYNKIKQINKY